MTQPKETVVIISRYHTMAFLLKISHDKTQIFCCIRPLQSSWATSLNMDGSFTTFFECVNNFCVTLELSSFQRNLWWASGSSMLFLCNLWHFRLHFARTRFETAAHAFVTSRNSVFGGPSAVSSVVFNLRKILLSAFCSAMVNLSHTTLFSGSHIKPHSNFNALLITYRILHHLPSALSRVNHVPFVHASPLVFLPFEDNGRKRSRSWWQKDMERPSRPESVARTIALGANFIFCLQLSLVGA